MKYIVTGSEGFIGKALVAFLVAKGHEVICIDRVNGDEAADMEQYLESNTDVAGVFHLAAQTSVFNPDTEQIRRDNIDTFIKVCSSCALHDVKLVYASSSTAAKGNATSMYGISKRFGEEYARLYHPNAFGVRLHNVYGPDPRQGTLLWHLMHDDVVDIYAMGTQLRHFTYIDDAVQGLYDVMVTEPGDELSKSRIINVNNPQRTQVVEFAMDVSARTGAKLRFHSEVRQRDNSVQSVDGTILSLSLHYKTVQEGLDAIFGKHDGMTLLKFSNAEGI